MTIREALQPNDLSLTQIREAETALGQYINFEYGVVVVDVKAAISLSKMALTRLEGKMKLKPFLSIIDFEDPVSVEDFLKFWGEREELLGDLHEGAINPNDMENNGYAEYPVFLFCNPTNLDELDEHALGSKERSKWAMEVVARICKYGRVNVAISPERLEMTGTGYSNVPEAYEAVLCNPEDVLRKLEISRYLYQRSGIEKLGFQQRVENPQTIVTPTETALKRIM